MKDEEQIIGGAYKPTTLQWQDKSQYIEASFEKKVEKDEKLTEAKHIKDPAPCPCCGYITIPNNGDAHAYICPICFWEIDFFIKRNNEPSDSNHSLTLIQARENYVKYGAAQPYLKEHCREPLPSEQPLK